MKKIVILTVLLSAIFFASCENLGELAQEKSVTKEDLDNDIAKESYAIGLDMATNLKGRGLEINPNIFFAGFNAGLAGTGALIDDEEKQGILMAMQSKMMQKMQEEMKMKASEAKEKGKKFLEENKGKEGVQTTESGLQYSVEKEGTGPKPAPEDTVEVHYKGTLLNGEVFDSSYDRGETVKFPLNRVIPGWTEGLQLMNKGAKYKLWIPSDLGYGDTGNQRIGPGETLIFEVELISFEKAAQK
jgi:FKBP-type peptidyl-prolyl cis-trans isomerase FkpA